MIHKKLALEKADYVSGLNMSLSIDNVSHQNYKHFMAQFSWLWLEFPRSSVPNASMNICMSVLKI